MRDRVVGTVKSQRALSLHPQHFGLSMATEAEKDEEEVGGEGGPDVGGSEGVGGGEKEGANPKEEDRSGGGVGKGGEKGTEEAAKVGRAFQKTRRRRAGRPEEVWVDPVEECEEVEWRQAEEEAQDVARMLKTRRGGGEANRGGRRRGVVGRSAGGGGPGGVAPGREPQDQPLQDSEEETADRPLAEPRGIQMQVTRRAASPVFALMCLNLSSLSRFEMRQ